MVNADFTNSFPNRTPKTGMHIVQILRKVMCLCRFVLFKLVPDIMTEVHTYCER